MGSGGGLTGKRQRGQVGGAAQGAAQLVRVLQPASRLTYCNIQRVDFSTKTFRWQTRLGLLSSQFLR